MIVGLAAIGVRPSLHSSTERMTMHEFTGSTDDRSIQLAHFPTTSGGLTILSANTFDRYGYQSGRAMLAFNSSGAQRLVDELVRLGFTPSNQEDQTD